MHFRLRRGLHCEAVDGKQAKYCRSASEVQMSCMKFVLTCLVLIAGGCDDRQEAHYATRTDAENDGAFARGWLPRWLPHAAANIVDAHDLDSNASAMTLTVPPDWRPPDDAQCKPSASANAPDIQVKGFPSQIEKRLDVSKRGDLFVVNTEGKMFAWRLPR